MPWRQQQHRQHTLLTHTLLGCYQLDAGLPAAQTNVSECFSQCLSGFPLIAQSTQNIPTCICHTSIPTKPLDAVHCNSSCMLLILPVGGCGGSLAISAYTPTLHKPIKPTDNEVDTAAASPNYKPAPSLSGPIIALALCLTALVALGLLLLLSNNFYKNRQTQWRRRLNASSGYPTRLQIDNPEHWPEFARTLRVIQEQAKSELPMDDDYYAAAAAAAGRPSYAGVEASSAVAFYSQQYAVTSQGQESRYRWQDDFDDVLGNGINTETQSPNTSQGASAEKNLRGFNLGVMPHILKSALLETDQVRSMTVVESCEFSSTERQKSLEHVDRKAASSSLYMDALEKNYEH
ncbi:hypothetical protein BJ741DRAFT_600121 [Chytriomyces cf. hyalinus JEL632]|nr:hypothetical protein BJ741DRAFT_600121 [Chytriomyces cf. hyalinus JEL632]